MTAKLELTDYNDAHGRPVFRLTDEYRCRLGEGCVITVPAGFKTNFGSIPRGFYWLCSPTEMREASIVHDFMCNEIVSSNGVPSNSGWSRWMADAVLHEMLVRIGFPWWKRLPVYFAVRAYAWMTRQHWPEAPEKLEIKE